MYLILELSAVFNAICALICGGTVWLKRDRTPVNKRFITLCGIILAWSAFYFFPLVSSSQSLSGWSFFLFHIPLIFFPVVNLHFICSSLKLSDKYRNLLHFGYAFAWVALFFHLFTPHFIAGVQAHEIYSYWYQPGLFYHVWVIGWTLQLLYGLWLLTRSYFYSKGIIQAKTKYLLLGSLVTFIFASSNFLPTYGVALPPLLNLLSATQLIVFSYSVQSHHYFHLNVKILQILRKLLFLFIASSVGYYLYYNVYYLFNVVSKNHFHWLNQPEAIGVAGFFLMLKVLHYFEPFRRLFQVGSYEKLKQSIEIFIHSNEIYEDINEMNSDLKELFTDLNYISEVQVLADKKQTQKRLPFTYKHMKKRVGTINRQEIVFAAQNQLDYDQDLLEELVKEKIVLVFPLIINFEIIGLFVVGEKSYQSFYAREEADYFAILSKHLSLKLSLIFYNKNLQDQVAKKTKSLREKTRQLKTSYRKLQELDKAKDSFLAITSHELRTPMTVIKGYADFLMKENFGPLNEQQKKFIGKITNNTEQLLHLVNDILDISKLEAGKMEFHNLSIRVKPFMKEITQMFQVEAQNKNINLQLKYKPRKNYEVNHDPESLKMIFNNLIGNALKFTNENGEISVVVHGEKKKGSLRFSVEDNGIGIAKEQQSELFQKFKQIGNYLQKTYTGTGLGLSIVKKIITRLEGDIWVESDTDKGSKFIFDIPFNHELQPH